MITKTLVEKPYVEKPYPEARKAVLYWMEITSIWFTDEILAKKIDRPIPHVYLKGLVEGLEEIREFLEKHLPKEEK